MKRNVLMAFALVAAALSQTAGAITATKEYVDRLATNRYTKAETDAKIVELAPPGITTNDVCAIVTNNTSSWRSPLGDFRYLNSSGSWIGHLTNSVGGSFRCEIVYRSHLNGWVLTDDASGLDLFYGVISHAAEDSKTVTFDISGMTTAVEMLGVTSITFTRKGLLKDYITKDELDEAIDSIPSPEIDTSTFATKSENVAVSNIAVSADTKANTLISYVNGDDVMDVVTNYDSAVHISSRSLRQRIEDGGSNVWRVVWDEMNRWNWFLPQIGYQTNALWSALSEKADRAWGFYDSHTGGWSPDGYTQISSPKILIAAGMAYQRHVTTGGAVWVLESNGLVTEVGGVASNGFFRISDDDGNALFEIVKGNKRTVGSTAGALTTTNVMGVTHLYITYAVEAAEHPTIEATTSLGTPFVSQESESSPVNVTWTGSTGDYHAEVWPKTASSSLFVRASHEVGGETYIKNTAPTGLDGGLIYNGVKYRVVPYSSGGKTYLTLEAW